MIHLSGIDSFAILIVRVVLLVVLVKEPRGLITTVSIMCFDLFEVQKEKTSCIVVCV